MKRLTMLSAPVLLIASLARGQDLEWARQFGTTTDDVTTDIASDSAGNIFISGFTRGNLAGTNAGDSDAFLIKYSTTGNLLWSRQFGTPQGDFARSVSADKFGNVYVAGHSRGTLVAPGPGGFIRKYDGGGNVLWTRQFGALNLDGVNSVSSDALGNVFVADSVRSASQDPDAYAAKYNADGTLQWSRQFGTPMIDYGNAVSADGLGNAYVFGETYGALGGANSHGPNSSTPDIFLAKFDSAGNRLWTSQSGTIEESTDVAADSLGNIFIAGRYFDSVVHNSISSIGKSRTAVFCYGRARLASIRIRGRSSQQTDWATLSWPAVLKARTISSRS